MSSSKERNSQTKIEDAPLSARGLPRRNAAVIADKAWQNLKKHANEQEEHEKGANEPQKTIKNQG